MNKITQKTAYIIELKDGVWLANDDQEWKDATNKRFAHVFFNKEDADYECGIFGLLYDEYPNMNVKEIK